MKKRKRHNQCVFRFFDAAPINLPDAYDTAQKLQMAMWNTFGKAGCSAGVEDMSDMGFWIYVHLRWSWRIFSDQPFEKKDIAFTAHGSLHDLVKDFTEDSLPKGQQVGHACHNDLLNASFGENFFDVAKIRIGADNCL